MVKRGKKSKKSPARDKALNLLIENNVALQKVLADVSLDIQGLTKEISNLLGTFKEASKTFGEEKAEEDIMKEEREELIPKLDELINQNKTIAKGLVLLESALKEKERSREFGF
ncbi:hypothetical protein ACFLZZ_03810 [Nanoarchaeota archaeon]